MWNQKDLSYSALKVLLWVIVILLSVILLLPTVYLFFWSTKGTSIVGILGDFSIKWFKAVLENPEWRKAFLYSGLIAFIASTVSLISVLLYFYFSIWRRGLYQSFAYFLLIGPLFFPVIVYGLALRLTFNAQGFPEWLPLILGHITLLFPVQYFLIESSNEVIKKEWVYSAATMGASHSEIIWRIIRPLLAKPILVSFGIGMLFSFDEVVIAISVIDSANATVPKRLWDVIHRDMDPTPAVIAILVLILCFLFMATYRFLSNTRKA